MSRVLITGSADGLGRMAAGLLVDIATQEALLAACRGFSGVDFPETPTPLSG